MTSSQETLPKPGQRERWADNVRVVVIAAVVVWHTSTAYLAGTDWYYMERTTSQVWSAVILPAEIVAIFALGPLFLIAGMFSAHSLTHRGPAAFARSRLVRLGVPLLLFIFVVDPLASYVGSLGEGGHPSLAGSLRSAEAGPMWFVAALLAFSLVYALLRRRRPTPRVGRKLATKQFVAAGLAIAVTAYLAWQLWPLDAAGTWMNLRWGLWPQGAVLFALGVRAGESGGLSDLAPRCRWLGWSALGTLALIAGLAAFVQAHGTFGSMLHGAGPATMILAVLYGSMSVTFTLWFTLWARARWSHQGPLLQRAGRGSYATYFLHPLVLTCIMVALASFAIVPELKFLLVSIVAVPVCFLVGYALTRLPGSSRVL